MAVHLHVVPAARDLTVTDNAALETEMLGLVEQDLRSAYAIADKMARHKAVDAAKAKVTARYFPEGVETPPYDKQRVGGVFKKLEAKIVRWNILDTSSASTARLATRAPDRFGVACCRASRPVCSLRGETQALVTPPSYRRGRSGSTRCRTLQGNVPAALQFPPSRSARPDAWRPAPRESATASSPAAIHHPLRRPRVPLPIPCPEITELKRSS